MAHGFHFNHSRAFSQEGRLVRRGFVLDVQLLGGREPQRRAELLALGAMCTAGLVVVCTGALAFGFYWLLGSQRLLDLVRSNPWLENRKPMLVLTPFQVLRSNLWLEKTYLVFFELLQQKV